LTNKEIDFLLKLSLNIKGKINNEDYSEFSEIINKILNKREKCRKQARETIAERRKINPSYARPYSQKKEE